MSKVIAKKWDYAASVGRVRPLVMKWGHLSIDMLGELHEAREALSREGRPPETGANAPVKTWADYCEDVALDKSTANRWLKMYDPKRHKLLQAPEPHVAHNSGDNEWYTPAEYIEAARKVLGTIDLDPASTPEANEVVKATRFYTAEDEGLRQEWRGRVWMNPPYGSGFIEPFCEKLVKHYKAGEVTVAIALVNNATETRWFQGLASAASAIVFPLGRVHFRNPETEKKSAPLQGQAVIYLGKEYQAFLAQFRSFGLGMKR